MFTRLFLSKKLSLISKKPLKILYGPQDFSTSGCKQSSFKDVSGDKMNVSLFNVKKSLKLANVEFEDGYTNLKTLCPVCDPKTEDVYINKTTGKIFFSTSYWYLILCFRSIRLPKVPLRCEIRTRREIFHNFQITENCK